MIIIPEGHVGRGWKRLADCFQEVVDYLSRSRKGNNSSGGVGQRSGVSFADAIKKKPSLVFSGKLDSKVGCELNVAEGSDDLILHAKKKEKHA